MFLSSKKVSKCCSLTRFKCGSKVLVIGKIGEWNVLIIISCLKDAFYSLTLIHSHTLIHILTHSYSHFLSHTNIRIFVFSEILNIILPITDILFEKFYYFILWVVIT